MDFKEHFSVDGPKVLIFGLLIVGGLMLPATLWGIAVLVADGILLYFCLRNIEADPPHVAIPLVWGVRLPIIIKEGWHIFAPFPPFMYDAITIPVESVNLDFDLTDIRTRQREDANLLEGGQPVAGGELSIRVSFTYHPDKTDASRLIEFLNRGSHKGVENILKEVIEEDVRQLGITRDWESITFSSDDLKWELVEKLTEKPRPENEEQKRELRREIEQLGVPDIMNLGIILTRINVGRIKEQGKLAEVAERSATERQERQAERVELDHVREQIEKTLQKVHLSEKDAVELVQTERGKITKKVQENKVTGLEGLGRGFRGE